MPRPARPGASVLLNTKLPTDAYAQAAAFLYSPIEGRIPHGAWGKFLGERIREHFNWRQLDLAPYGFGQGYFVRGPKEMLDELERRLRNG